MRRPSVMIHAIRMVATLLTLVLLGATVPATEAAAQANPVEAGATQESVGEATASEPVQQAPAQSADPNPAKSQETDGEGDNGAEATEGDPDSSGDVGAGNDPADPDQDDAAPGSTLPGSIDPESTIPESTTTPDETVDDHEGTGYGSQGPFVPDSVNQQLLAQARQQLEQARTEVVEIEELVKLRDESLAGLSLKIEQLEGDTSNLVEQAADVRDEMRSSAISSFKKPSAGYTRVDTDFESASEAQVYRRMVGHIATRNAQAIDRFAELRAQLDDEDFALVVETNRLTGERDSAMSLAEQRRLDVEQAELAVATYEAAGAVYIPNVVFPVAEPYGFPLINSWGFDRARGTSDSHWHEGIDIFAKRGTPLLAAESGVVSNVGSGRLGGLVVSIVGDSGTRWYYAHLDGFAPGLTEGQVVQAGDEIGYLGDSGNARGTPPHLHLEIHPPGMNVINPYPQLNVLAVRDRTLAAQSETESSGDANVSANETQLG